MPSAKIYTDSNNGSEFSVSRTMNKEDLITNATLMDGAIEQKWNQFVTALYGVLYSMSQDPSASQNTIYSLAAIEALQMCFFAFAPAMKFPWNSVPAQSFGYITEVLQFGFYFEKASASSFWGIYTTIIIYIVLTTVNASFVGVYFTQNQTKKVWTLKLLRMSARLATGFLFIPCITVLLSLFQCKKGPGGNSYHVVDSAMQCWTSTHLVLIFFTVPILLIFIIFSMISALMYIERNPMSSNPLAKPNGRVGFWLLVLKAFVTFLFVVYLDTDHQWFLAIVVLFSSMFLLFSYIWYLPYYSPKTNKIFVITSTIYFWAGICLLFGMIFARDSKGTENPSASVLFFLALPFVCMTMLRVVDHRYEKIDMMDFDRMENTFLAEIKLRRHIYAYRAERQQDFFNPYLQMPVVEKSKYKVYDAAAHDEENSKSSREKVIDGLNKIQEVFPRSAFCQIYIASCYEMVLDNKLQAFNYIRNAEQLEPTIDEMFFIYFGRKRDEESSDGTAKLDAMSLVTFDNHKKNAQRLMINIHKVQLKFWSELLSKSPSFDVCQELSREMYDLTVDTQLHFKKLLQINGGSSSVIRLYATFVTHTMNDPWRGQSLMNYANSIDKENEREMKKMKKEMNEIARQGKEMNFFVSSIKPSDLENEKNVFFTLSAEMSNIGTILDCKGDIEGVFGYKRRDVINKNINMVIPEPFSSPHDELLKKYLRDGHGDFMGKTRLAPGLHKDGYLIQMALTLRESLSSDHPTFLGIVQRGDMFGEVLIIDKEFVVTASSRNCSSIFDYNLSELKERRIHATELFPGFDDKDEREAMSGSRITLNGEAFEVIIAPTVMPIIGDMFLVKMIPVLQAIGTVKAESSRMSSVNEEEEEEEKSEEFKIEDRSVASSTGASTRSFFSTIRSLRDKVDPNMQKLKKRSIFTLLMVIVTIIIASSFLSVSINSLQTIMKAIQENVHREEYVATTYSLTRQMDWYESDILPDLPSKVYDRLVSDMDNLDMVHSDINKKYTEENMDRIEALDSDSELEVFIPVGSSINIEYKGLWELILQYLTKVEVVIEETDITNNNRIDSINYIALNGPGSIKEATKLATEYFTEYHKKIEDHGMSILQYLTIVFVCVVIMLFIMGIVTIYKLYLQQERMFGMFLKISRADVIRIQSIMKKTISKLKGVSISDGSLKDNDDSDDSDDSDEDERRKNAKNKALGLDEQRDQDLEKTVKKSSSFSRLIAASFSAKSHTWLLSLIGKFSFFFIVPLVFILFEYYYSNTVFYDIGDIVDEIRVSGMRSVLVHEIHYTLQDFVVSDPGSDEANSTYHELLQLNEDLKELEHQFIFGGGPYAIENVKVSDVKATQTNILYGDACAVMTSTDHNCTAFDDGLLVNGLHGGLVEYMYLSSRVAYMRKDLNASINATFLSEEYDVVEQLNRIYLPEIIMGSTYELESHINKHLEDNKSEATIINVIAGIVVTLSYLFYRTNATRLENILKHNRSLPLIIPVEIAPRIKALKEYMKSTRKELDR